MGWGDERKSAEQEAVGKIAKAEIRSLLGWLRELGSSPVGHNTTPLVPLHPSPGNRSLPITVSAPGFLFFNSPNNK